MTSGFVLRFFFLHKRQVNATPVKLDLQALDGKKRSKSGNDRRKRENEAIECNFLK